MNSMRSFIVVALIVSCVSVCSAVCPVTGQSDTTGQCPHFKHNGAGFDGRGERVQSASISYGKDVTFQGCTCKTTCGASLDTGLANCDWCYTENSCGNFGLEGHWDYCKYPVNTTYEAQTAQQKQSFLWNEVIADRSSGSYPNVLGIVDESIQTSFMDNWDWMPTGRKKYIHSEGAVCPFTFTASSDSPYTGVWKAGATSYGLIRMGSATPVTTSSGVVPGLGIKFLRDNHESGNFVALHTLSPLPNKDYNFFGYTLSNHIPPATGFVAILAKKFGQASGCVNQVGLSDICAYEVDGTAVSSPNFPFKVTLTAGAGISMSSSPISQEELQHNLASIPSGASLFEVYHYESPTSTTGVHLGTITTTAQCSNSRFGDDTLFFRHQRIEDDWALRPSWMSQIDPEQACGTSSISATPPKECHAYD